MIEEIIVYLDTEIGLLKGIWKSKKQPVLHNIEHVEFSVNLCEESILEVSKDMATPNVSTNGNRVSFCGDCEAKEECC